MRENYSTIHFYSSSNQVNNKMTSECENIQTLIREVGNWAKFFCAGQAVVSNMYPAQGGTFHLIICLYYSHLLDDCLKVWFIKLGWRILPSTMSNKLKFSISWKPIPHFWSISVQWVSLFPWKYLLVNEKELFCWWEVSKFLCVALFVNARKVDVSEFQVKN